MEPKEGVENAIEITDLSKVFVSRSTLKRTVTKIRALNGVSFGVKRGEIFGILGPNGAGKTTLINIISTLIIPDSGRVKVLGYDVVEDGHIVRQLIGVESSKHEFYWRLTGWDNLKFYGRVFGMEEGEIERRGSQLLEMVGMVEKKSVRVENYSTGMLKRLSLARVLLPDPEILLFDEPTTGLDALYAKEFRETIKKLKQKGKTIIVTTHNLSEAEVLCDRVAILNKGDLLVVNDIAGLRGLVEKRKIIKIKPRDAIETDDLRKIKGVSSVKDDETTNTRNIIFSEEMGDISEVMELVKKQEEKIETLYISKPSLEDIFIELTGEKSEQRLEGAEGSLH